MNNDKCFQFDFIATTSGYGVVYAKDKEQAIELINKGDYDDIIDTFDLEIQEITDIKED